MYTIFVQIAIDSAKKFVQFSANLLSIFLTIHWKFLLLTIEDALERLVGDIEDEFDPEQQSEIEPAQDGAWFVKGETLLSELSEKLAALISIGVPCVSSAHTYTASCPIVRIARANMSVCIVSTMCPK